LKAHRDPVAHVALVGTLTGEIAKDIRSRHTPFGIGRKMAAIIGKITVNANDLCDSPSRVLDDLQQKLAILTKAGK
jgi:hypothetical protein